jgi:hypothetical protein
VAPPQVRNTWQAPDLATNREARVKARKLYQLLDTSDGGKALRKAVASGLSAFREGLSGGARSAPIDVESDGSLLVIAAPHLVILCEAYLAKQIDEVELAYIATALDRASDFRFVTDMTEEFAFLLSSGNANTEAVNAVLRLLREHIA